MTGMVSISRDEYNEYLELKKDRDDAIEHVDASLQALKEGKVYDL